MAKRPENFVTDLSDILIRRRVILPEEAKVYQAQYEASDLDSFEDFLLDQGRVSKEEILEALGDFYKVPWIDLGGILMDPDLVRNFPKDFLLRNEIIPITLEEDFLTVAAAHPDDETLLPKIGQFVDADVRFQISLPRDITDIVEENYEAALTEIQSDVDIHDELARQDAFEHSGEIREDEEE